MTDALALSITPESLKQGAAALRADLEYIQTLKRQIDTPAKFQMVGGLLIEQLKVLDAMQAQRDGVTKPMHEAWKNACALFSEGLELQKSICSELKLLVGEYELAQDTARALATQEARAALASGDVQTVERALTVVNESAAKAQGVSTKFSWKIKRIAPDLLPDAYWVVSEALINDEAKRQGVLSDDPPVIPGVVFERTADVTGRRK
jgi:hypothetical protein